MTRAWTRLGPVVSLTLVGGAALVACSADEVQLHRKKGGAAATTTVEGVTACAASGVGDTPLRRLTKKQYDNSVRDLLGVDATAADAFPVDGEAGPIPANPTIPVTDAQVRLLQSAAEELGRTAVDDAHFAALVTCDLGTDQGCVDRTIRELATRAFRRPATAGQFEALGAVYESGRAGATPRDGIALVVTALLQSPLFLYHAEWKPSVPGATFAPLDDYELASRLSYFLWETMPDATLFDAAAAGRLRTADELARQAERMLASPRAHAMIASFAQYWLGIANVEKVVRDRSLFPDFTPELATAMKLETTASMDRAFFGDGSFTTLMTSSRTVVDDRLLPIYGIVRPPGQDASAPLELPANLRSGILTQPSVLVAHSPPDHASPVTRGVFLLNNVLCDEIGLPRNIEVPTLPPFDPSQTTRERFLAHEADGCSGCHKPIDHLGFTFGRYDAVGRYVIDEVGKPIDDSGSLEIGDPAADGPATGAVAMIQKMVGSQAARACFAKQIQRLALRRKEVAEDSCTLSLMEKSFATDLDMRSLVVNMVRQDNFRLRPAGVQ